PPVVWAHCQLFDSGELGKKCTRNAVAQILGLLIGSRIDEGEHGHHPKVVAGSLRGFCPGGSPVVAPARIQVVQETPPRLCRSRVRVRLGSDWLWRCPYDPELSVALNLPDSRRSEAVLRLRIDAYVAAWSLQVLVQERATDFLRVQALRFIHCPCP